MAGAPTGFTTDPGFDPAEDHTGPFYFREQAGEYHCVFTPEAKNCNVNGIVHGGVLMIFADFSLCIAATDHYEDESCSTVSFHADFVAAAEIGNTVSCTPRVVRKTGSMVFITGDLRSAGDTVMTFNAVVKRLRNP